jgi:hypothetical protein
VDCPDYHIPLLPPRYVGVECMLTPGNGWRDEEMPLKSCEYILRSLVILVQKCTRGCQNSFTFFAENTKITTKTTIVNKLYFSHARTDIIYIKDI